MQDTPEKKKDSTYGNKTKENSTIKTRDDERKRLEKWKIGRKNFS